MGGAGRWWETGLWEEGERDMAWVESKGRGRIKLCFAQIPCSEEEGGGGEKEEEDGSQKDIWANAETDNKWEDGNDSKEPLARVC